MSKTNIDDYISYIDENHAQIISPNSLAKSVLLAYFVGIFGVHRFYNGKYLSGLIQFLTFGGFCIWWIFDLISLGQEKFTDSRNRILKWGYVNGDRAGFCIRMLGYTLDILIINLSLGFIFLFLSIDNLMDSQDNYYQGKDLIMFFTVMMYFTIFNYLYGATPGKIMMKLEIINEDNSKISFIQSLIRYIGYFFSYILMVGFLMIGYRKDKRSLHDLIAGTKVVFVKPQYETHNDQP